MAIGTEPEVEAIFKSVHKVQDALTDDASHAFGNAVSCMVLAAFYARNLPEKDISRIEEMADVVYLGITPITPQDE
jgi:hypothetical protein